MNLYLRLLLLRLRILRGRRSRLGVWDTARTPFRVVPTDLDLLGHMNNGRYLTILDLGRMDLMLRSGFWGKITSRGWYPVVAGQTISYRKSLVLGQRFEVHSRILGMDERWNYLEQSFVVGDEVYAQALIRARFLKRSGGSVSSRELLDMVGEMPADRVLPSWISAWAEATKPAKTVGEWAAGH